MLIRILCLSSVVLLACGCSNRMGNAQATSDFRKSEVAAQAPESDIRLASASTAKAVTFTDLPKLQYGTGPQDPNGPGPWQTQASGLRYRILRGSGGRKPIATDQVRVHYRGWLDDGTEFDSSYDGNPISFGLNQVVAGWTEGMQQIGEGGMIELWIPARLGYGQQGSGRVPPNATLHFVVELLSIQ